MRKKYSIFILMMFLFVVVGCSSKGGNFEGKYHVLNGIISPIDGITPDELNKKFQNIHECIEFLFIGNQYSRPVNNQIAGKIQRIKLLPEISIVFKLFHNSATSKHNQYNIIKQYCKSFQF